MMKYFSMFSGIGGFELGIQRAMDNKHVAKKQQNGERWDGIVDEQQFLLCPSDNSTLCVGYSEINKYAIEIYNKHFGGKNYGDATKINVEELPDFDLLVGGFPCQAFSIAGKRRGFEDTRGTMFFEIARVLKGKQPRLFILENVKGLLNHDGGNTFTKILQTIDELGYDAEWQVLNSKHFGVPQNRERVFIIGHLRGTSSTKVFPIVGGSGLYPKEITEGVSDAQRIYTTSCAKTLKGEGGGQGAKTGLYAIPKNSYCIDSNYHKGASVKDYWTIRRLTPKECERLQGFPDGWTDGLSDTQRYKCLGNAVTVNVIEAIIKKVMNNE